MQSLLFADTAFEQQETFRRHVIHEELLHRTENSLGWAFGAPHGFCVMIGQPPLPSSYILRIFLKRL